MVINLFNAECKFIKLSLVELAMGAYKGKDNDSIIFYCVQNPHIACNVYTSIAKVFAF